MFLLPTVRHPNEPISMIMNPVFSKSGKVLNSILKNQIENQSKMSPSAAQEIQTSNLFKKREDLWTCAKKLAKSLECIL
mgnify:CR=1 FL=1